MLRVLGPTVAWCFGGFAFSSTRRSLWFATLVWVNSLTLLVNAQVFAGVQASDTAIMGLDEIVAFVVVPLLMTCSNFNQLPHS